MLNMLKQKKSDILFKICISLVLLFFLYTVVITVLVLRKVEHKDYNYTPAQLSQAKTLLQDEFYSSSSVLSQQEYKYLLDREIRVKPYILTRIKIKEDGRTFPYYRVININPDVDGIEYCVILAHEMIHLKYMIMEERFVEFTTFKTLYESKNEHLHKAGCYLGLGVLNDRYPEQYNCKGEIIEYLIGEQEC